MLTIAKLSYRGSGRAQTQEPMRQENDPWAALGQRSSGLLTNKAPGGAEIAVVSANAVYGVPVVLRMLNSFSMLKQGEGIGCAGAIAGVCLLSMGFVALSFSGGSYSSFEQELWYRYGSIAFLIFGATMPACLLWFWRRFPLVVGGAVIWMIAALILFAVYIFLSGGGV